MPRFLRLRYKSDMPFYRIDFMQSEGTRLATHKIDYCCDEAAIKGAHTINGHPTIGSCFRVWEGERLVHEHFNEP
jgi:hypothetical protein